LTFTLTGCGGDADSGTDTKKDSASSTDDGSMDKDDHEDHEEGDEK